MSKYSVSEMPTQKDSEHCKFIVLLESVIDVGQGISIGHGKFVKKN